MTGHLKTNDGVVAASVIGLEEYIGRTRIAMAIHRDDVAGRKLFRP